MESDSLLAQLSYGLPQFKLLLVKECKIEDQSAPIAIGGPEDVLDFLGPLFHASEEYFVSFHLNAKNELLGLHEVSHGTLSASLVHPREVFKAAFLANSHAIIVCHNHPSGAHLKPSADDLATTENLIQAGSILGVSLLDHLIVGAGDCYSIREQHPLMWSAAA